jgi:general secretion pathway protein G
MLRKEKGFTLIELLIVVAIIGIIAAIAVPNLLTAIQRSKRSRTAADMRAMGTGLGTYQVDNNAFPATIAALITSGHYTGATVDAWQTAFTYVTDASGSSYTITSLGKDKAAGGTAEFTPDITFSNGIFTGGLPN